MSTMTMEIGFFPSSDMFCMVRMGAAEANKRRGRNGKGHRDRFRGHASHGGVSDRQVIRSNSRHLFGTRAVRSSLFSRFMYFVHPKC